MYAQTRPIRGYHRHAWSDRCDPTGCSRCGRSRRRRPSLWTLALCLAVAAWFVFVVAWLIMRGTQAAGR